MSLFPELEPEPKLNLPKNGACVPAPLGTGPEGETCGTCQHCSRNQYRDYAYTKCLLMEHAWSHSSASDIKKRWPACREWKAKETPDAT